MSSTILGSLTLLVLAASVFIGLKNKTKDEERIQTRIQEDTKNTKLSQQLVKEKEKRDKTKAERIKRTEDSEALAKSASEQKAKNDELSAKIDEKKKLIEDQKAKIAQVVDALKELGDIEELIPKVKSLKTSIVQLNADIEAENIKLSALISEQKRTSGVVTGFETENAWRSALSSNPALKTRVGRIYESHGFVSLPVGNAAGVVNGSTLEVVRDGGVIAKLLVKAVESSTSAAELVPGSLAAETVLMEGDSVRSLAAAAAPAMPKPPMPVDALPAENPLEATPTAAPAAAPGDALFE